VEPLLPAGFDGWFRRCVVREQSMRFPDARAALEALRTVHGGAAASPGPDPRGQAGVTVRTGDMSPESKTALEAARTIGVAPAAPAPVDADEELRAIPTQKSPVLAIAAGALLVLGAGLFFALRPGAGPSADGPDLAGGTGATPTATSGSAGAGGMATELRCPKTMAAIPGGAFSMGSSSGEADEKPVHSVSLNAFCLDTTEVLVSEYAECVLAKRCAPASSTVSWLNIKPEDKELFGAACNAGHPERGDSPVNCVTWDEADAYCTWAKKRLPTEEEWEYAARGKEGRTFPWGEEPPSARRLNACGAECAKSPRFLDQGYIPLFEGSDGYETTAPAQSFKEGRTPEGVFDMAGNVWEWTASHYCPYPGNNCAGEWRVARGGAWNSDAREGVKATRRDKNAHDARASDIGFRCAI
jgi:formylglycine-generating enzyme required for sulfatase activity